MTFSGSSSLNGKLKVDVDSSGASVYIYMMPNNFNKETSDTIGIVENNQIKAKVETGSFEVPSDWTIFIAYNVGYLDGFINVKSWAEEYTKSDKQWISEWAPTGTYYVDEEEIARLQAEREALAEEERLEQERLEAEILAQQELERQASADAEATRKAQEAIAKLEEEQRKIAEKQAQRKEEQEQ